MALAGLSAVFLFEMLDNSILNVALPTIGRELHASTAALQWVTSAYSVVFGCLMLPFGALADRVGRRRVMLIGLVLLALASLATAFVTTAGQLIGVRMAMGVAAAMTTPGSIALAFRLFGDDDLRVRAINLISTVGLVGLAVGPTAGGLALAVLPWQALLLVNVPIAVLAIAGVRYGIRADVAADLHREWHPLEDLRLVARPLVSSGLAFKGAANLAIAGLGYLVTLQLQLRWGWPPALAAVGMLPQVAVLVAGGAFVTPFVRRVGLERAAWISAVAVVIGLAVYGSLSTLGYVFVAVALVLVAAGLRVVGVVAGTNVLRGLPENRTTIGAALSDTAGQVASFLGIAVGGTILATLVTGDVATSGGQGAQFDEAVTLAGLVLTAVAAALVGWGILRSRHG